jgi:hypothetical protein
VTRHGPPELTPCRGSWSGLCQPKVKQESTAAGATLSVPCRPRPALWSRQRPLATFLSPVRNVGHFKTTAVDVPRGEWIKRTFTQGKHPCKPPAGRCCRSGTASTTPLRWPGQPGRRENPRRRARDPGSDRSCRRRRGTWREDQDHQPQGNGTSARHPSDRRPLTSTRGRETSTAVPIRPVAIAMVRLLRLAGRGGCPPAGGQVGALAAKT